MDHFEVTPVLIKELQQFEARKNAYMVSSQPELFDVLPFKNTLRAGKFNKDF